MLREEIAGSVRPLPDGAAGKHAWDTWGEGIYGCDWLDVPFLWAESYFYRLLLEAVGYYEHGPWHGIDPFVQKNAELHDPELAAELAAINPDHDDSATETAALIHAALWGNRADLGFRISDPASAAREHNHANIIDDQTAQAVDLLRAVTDGTITLIADNSGRELIPDLLLIDHLLRINTELTVELHLKPHPYYVSDATTTDLLATLRLLASIPGRASDTADHLITALRNDRLHLSDHEFYCAPLPFREMPPDLEAQLSGADAVILKGDLNYRRLTGDQHWPTATPFNFLTEYFPTAVIALRTLKSDLAIGIDSPTTARLESSDPTWRTSGHYGVVQIRSCGIAERPPATGLGCDCVAPT
ncbi:damage-control phosphatase ARMT1 family protein, partial [Nocardia sp. NPDC058497]|uniref:damage-control phosphatase ARMT1 family protein n=1 Tax=Nocardia sp. NPDC058497 TaxID=3346529 RepID=UPI00365F47C4